jgi:hypothetical protein
MVQNVGRAIRQYLWQLDTIIDLYKSKRVIQ